MFVPVRSACTASSSPRLTLVQTHDFLTDSNPERRKMRTDRVGDIARSKMGIMLFGHPRIGVPELCSNDAHRYASHGERRPVRMAENMETDDRRNTSTAARLGKRSLLMR